MKWARVLIMHIMQLPRSLATSLNYFHSTFISNKTSRWIIRTHYDMLYWKQTFKLSVFDHWFFRFENLNDAFSIFCYTFFTNWYLNVYYKKRFLYQLSRLITCLLYLSVLYIWWFATHSKCRCTITCVRHIGTYWAIITWWAG